MAEGTCASHNADALAPLGNTFGNGFFEPMNIIDIERAPIYRYINSARRSMLILHRADYFAAALRCPA